jgi:hypothetical protein
MYGSHFFFVVCSGEFLSVGVAKRKDNDVNRENKNCRIIHGGSLGEDDIAEILVCEDSNMNLFHLIVILATQLVTVMMKLMSILLLFHLDLLYSPAFSRSLSLLM